MNLNYPTPAVAFELSKYEKTQKGIISEKTIHRIAVRTLTHRTTGIMTTNRIAIQNDSLHNWPIFTDIDIPPTLGVMSIEIRRRLDEDIPSTGVMAAQALVAAMRTVAEPFGSILLIALGDAISPSGRSASYRAERDKLWSTLEKSGAVLPAGERLERKLACTEGSSRFAGIISVAIEDLPIALEVTRQINSVCICEFPRSSTDSAWQQVAPLLEHCPPDQAAMLRELIPTVTGDMFVARSFGSFDDVSVGVDIFAQHSMLSRLS
jgi:hypothetical protein